MADCKEVTIPQSLGRGMRSDLEDVCRHRGGFQSCRKPDNMSQNHSGVSRGKSVREISSFCTGNA